LRSGDSAGVQHQHVPFRRSSPGRSRPRLDLLRRGEGGRRATGDPTRAPRQRGGDGPRHPIRSRAPRRSRVPLPSRQRQRRPRGEAPLSRVGRPTPRDDLMRPLEDARAEVLETVFPLGSETVPLAEAEGRILAEDVRAPTDVPPFPNSAMDGFAVIASDVASPPVRLRVVEDVPAGSVATRTVTSGTAIKIMTGAPMPAGADAVVKVEVTRQPDPETVEILEAVAPGTAVRPAGGDIPAGSLVLGAGAALGPVELGLLATAGVGSPRVGRRPRVALMATGDELRPAETVALEPGQIRDSNRPLLRGLIHQAGGEVIDLGIVGDEEAALTNALNRAAEESDAIVTSGGVSMGEYDLIKRVLSARGTVDFWQVAMQPAKPFAFGHIESVPLFGLPGNPVSVMVAFEQF